MARNYADRIQEAYPAGPYNLLGWSFGGVIAHEVAIELRARGCSIGGLSILDAQPSIDSSVISQNHALSEEHVLNELLRFYRIGISEGDEPLDYEQLER